MKQFTPIGDRVLIQEFESEQDKKTAGGIIIPSTATAEDVKMGKVVAVGPGLYTQNGVLIPMTVQVGDEVALPAYGQSQEIRVGDSVYTLYRESELLGTFNETV